MIAYIKIEAPDLDTLDTILAPLVEEHGGSHYTLVVDGEAQRMSDRHLDEEEREGRAIASALRRLRRGETPDPVLEDVLGTGPFPDHPIT